MATVVVYVVSALPYLDGDQCPGGQFSFWPLGATCETPKGDYTLGPPAPVEAGILVLAGGSIVVFVAGLAGLGLDHRRRTRCDPASRPQQ